MPTIRANRESIDDRFSVLGFTVRTESPLFEVCLATDPELFRAGAQRTRRNFYSSRVHGAMRARRGEAVYLVPQEVLANFLGQPRLYFGLATYREGATAQPEAVLAPSSGNMYINLSGLTERGLRRVSGTGVVGSSYGAPSGPDASLQWGGDTVGMSTAAPKPKSNGNGTNGTAAPAKSTPYDDGFGEFPAQGANSVPAAAQALRPTRPFSAEDDEGMGIEGGIPDDEASMASAQGVRALTTPSPEYPQATRFEPAAPSNYRASRGTRRIERVVIHITDGGPRINGTIGWFKNPKAKVSSHYIVGQDGEVVQMVRHNDVAWHARSANSNSIGIEHCANTRGLNPTAAQLCASAALVAWLCDEYSIPVDRIHILGHSEADTRTTHTGCPNSVWDWDYFMNLITTRSCMDPPPGSRIRGTAPQPTRAMSAAATRPFSAEDDEGMGIEGGIPDDEASMASAQGVRALTTPTPEYPQATRFEPASPSNYRASRGTRRIERVVIHITDGGPRINGTIGWFKNPKAKVSSHYVVGQDGEVVQMVRHNDVAWHARSANSNSIGIEHNANTRGLNPTAAQLCASAALVAWLCDEYSIPVDRTHILGHSEADTRTTHTGCPNSVWDWDYYMNLITTRSCVDPPPGSRIRGTAPQPARAMSAATTRAVVVRAQEIITPFYDPSDPGSALTCQNDAFSQAREEWFVGVSNTRTFPHSAICQLKMTASDGSRYQGTGFYIGRNRILTCAHNLSGMASCTIIPGRNGGGSDNAAQPFGQVTVNASAWRVAPGYTGDGNYPNDLAVIDNVPLAAPNGKFFKFLNATPSDRMPIVVCGYSAASDAVPALTAAIDRDKQHLHGGYATQQTDLETIDYAILTLKGASGSPVYHIDAGSGQLEALITAVHVSGAPAAQGANRGCFITPSKIDWIEGRTTSFATRALGMESFSTHWETTPHYPQSSPMSCWAASAAMIVGWRDQRRVADTEIAAKVPVFEAYKNGLFPEERRALADAWNLVPEAAASYTVDSWHDMLRTYGPLYIDMTWDTSGGGHARVLMGMTSDGAPDGSDTVMYMHDPWPDSPGRIKLSFADFLALYEGRTQNSGGQLQYQILHAASIPAQCRPTLAAPFCLATADTSGRIMLPHRSSEGSAPQFSVAPPPQPIMQQLQRSKALTVPAAVEIASVVAGATMERIANNEGDITWELDQLRGFKHPNDTAPSPLPPAQDGTVIRIADWPRVSDSNIDDIFAGFEINWQYNGKCVGNVMISNIATNDAVGWGLTVKAKIMDDNIVYPRDNPSFAALRLRLEYRFTHVLVRDQIAIVDVHLFGNGKYNMQSRWEQTGMM